MYSFGPVIYAVTSGGFPMRFIEWRMSLIKWALKDDDFCDSYRNDGMMIGVTQYLALGKHFMVLLMENFPINIQAVYKLARISHRPI